MKKLAIKKVATHIIKDKLPDSLQHEIPRMQEIYENLFDRDGPIDINKLLKHRGDSISLALFYGKDNKLAGFAIAGVQTVNINRNTHAIFSAGVYSDLKYNIRKKLAKFALMKSLKYKLRHPTHRLGYLAETLTPASYSFSAKLLPECYPHPLLKTPGYISSIIKAISIERNFIKEDDSKFIVSFFPKIVTKNPQRLFTSSKLMNCKYYHYYLSLNPFFQDGNALLTYMPLTLKNILLGLKNYITWCMKK
jgi:hypothetical protein